MEYLVNKCGDISNCLSRLWRLTSEPVDSWRSSYWPFKMLS